MIKTKKAVICALSALLVAFSAGVAGAQTDYPSRPIHFIVGFAADNCVFFTAVEAHMRDYNVVVPSDCCESETDEERRHALAKMRKFLDADTSGSRGLRLRR